MARIDTAALPNRVREHREAAGLTLRELAAKVGLAHASLYRLETGVRELNLFWMEKLGEIFGVPEADLLHPWQGGLSEAERAMLEGYRALPADARRMIQSAIEAHAEPAPQDDLPAEPERRRA